MKYFIIYIYTQQIHDFGIAPGPGFDVLMIFRPGPGDLVFIPTSSPKILLEIHEHICSIGHGFLIM
jgi:hypothetical protein